jgi:hypothetical protein
MGLWQIFPSPYEASRLIIRIMAMLRESWLPICIIRHNLHVAAGKQPPDSPLSWQHQMLMIYLNIKP